MPKTSPLSVTTLLSCLLYCLMSGGATSAAPVAARLAVLECQGDVGTVKDRQRWSDHAREVALERMRGSGVRVLDRADFEALLPPDASLSTCVGQCSAQVARSIGAHWALSTHLDQRASTVYVTLKLHSADGTLLSVKQAQRTLLALDDQLGALIGALTSSALEPIAPFREPRVAAPLYPEPDHLSNMETKGEQGQATRAHPPSPPIAPLKWWRVAQGRRGRCVSERVRWADYQRCVDAGACVDPPRRAGCERVAREPVRCVHLSQALSYTSWLQRQAPSLSRGGQRLLPTLPELRALRASHPEELSSGGAVTMEWVVTEQSPTAPLSLRALKVASKELTARLNHRGELVTRPTPPAFQLPQLGFRLSARSRRGACPPLP